MGEGATSPYGETMKMATIIMITILALPLLGGCKKDPGAPAPADYRVDTPPTTGLGGTAPTTPCVNKGAVGAQGLLLKAECPKLKLSECGNKKTEAGEECDPPNGTDCSDQCKIIPKKPPLNLDKPFVKLTPEALSDGVVGTDYISATLKASGSKVSDSFVWPESDQKIPAGFELKVDKSGKQSSAQIVSKTPVVYSKDGYKATVTACLASDSKVCTSREYAFKITDELMIKAYDLKDLIYSIESLYEEGKPFCTSFEDANPCGPFIIPANDLGSLMGTYKASYTTGTGAYMMIVLHASGLQKNDMSFAWSISVDGKELPNSVVKSAEKKWPEGLFLLDYSSGKKVYADSHFLVVNASVIKSGGAEYKNVVVTVKNETGAKREIVFDKIKIPSAKDIAAVPPPVSPPAPAPEVPLAITAITLNGVLVTGAQNPMYGLVYAIEPMVGTDLKIKFDITDPKAKVTAIDQPSSDTEWVIDADGKTISYAFPQKGETKELNFKAWVTVTGADGKSKTKAMIVMSPKFPDPSTLTIDQLKNVYVDMETAWTDVDSKISIQLQDSQGQVLAATAFFAVDGLDPSKLSLSSDLVPGNGMGEVTLDKISKVVVQQQDPGSGPAMRYAISVLRIKSTYWYAENNKPSSLSITGLFGELITVFGIWGGVTDGDTDFDSHPFPTDFKLVSNKWWPSQKAWIMRPHYGDLNLL